MPTAEILKGPQFEIRGWVGRDGQCQVLKFLADLKANGDTDAGRLAFLMERTANVGIVRNDRQMRELSEGIFEFKAPNTARILFFYDRNRLIICSHGFRGKPGKAKKVVNAAIENAKDIRLRYFAEKR
jgi:hypothetical protein